MKILLVIIIVAMIGTFAPVAAAQSNRVRTKETPKTDQAIPKPEPTPPANSKPAAENDVLSEDDIIKINTQLVSIPVRVMDKKGRFVAGLSKQNFKVTENGQEQEIAIFGNEEQPFTVALVIDVSYSATFKISEIQSAAIAFIDQLRPQDKVMVVSFAEDVLMLCEPTSDRNTIYRAIRKTQIATGTSVYEAVDLVMNDRLRSIEGRKAMILFTDGVDTTSRRVHDRDNLDDALELDALIYTIRYDTFEDVQSMTGSARDRSGSPDPRTIDASYPPTARTVRTLGDQGTTVEEYRRAAQYLDQLTLRTGGRLYPADSLGNVNRAYSQIASELREFYSIAYYPIVDRAAGSRAFIKVRVDQPGLSVRSRETILRRTPKK